jgi:intraflagellar transport protein 56
VVFRGGENAL